MQIWGLALFCAGILWAGAVNGAWLSAWFFGAARATDAAVAPAWIIALFTGVMGAASRWKGTLDAPAQRAPLQRQLARAGRAAARPLACALLAFFVFCALGFNWPFGAVWRQIAPASLAIAATWLGAALVTNAGERVPRYAGAFGWLNRLWFYGGPLLYVALHWLNVDVQPIKPQIYLLSPWTLWWTLRQPAIAEFPLFWPAIAAHCALIAASALAIVWRARQTEIFAAPPENAFEGQWKDAAPADADAQIEPAEIEDDDEDDDEDETAATAPAGAVLGRPVLPAPDAELSRVLQWQSRFHNPLLLLETRRVIGNGLRGTRELALILSGALLLVLVVILPAWGLYNGAYPAEIAVAALAISLLVWGTIALNGIEGTSRCYDHDRVDGSLQMLFLTPLTEREIAIGKLGPFLARAALLLAFYSPLWLVGLLPALYFQPMRLSS